MELLQIDKEYATLQIAIRISLSYCLWKKEEITEETRSLRELLLKIHICQG
ncbi:MAG: hypothetical protein E7C72_08375 [Dialister sp.]|nr:hypothetical protein [Dialister sp.]